MGICTRNRLGTSIDENAESKRRFNVDVADGLVKSAVTGSSERFGVTIWRPVVSNAQRFIERRGPPTPAELEDLSNLWHRRFHGMWYPFSSAFDVMLWYTIQEAFEQYDGVKKDFEKNSGFFGALGRLYLGTSRE